MGNSTFLGFLLYSIYENEYESWLYITSSMVKVIFGILTISALWFEIYLIIIALNGLALTIYKKLATKKDKSLNEFWYPARKFLAQMWLMIGEFYYGYEVVNFDHIPSKGPALLIYFHGAVSNIDWIFLSSKMLLEKNRLMWSVIDKSFRFLPRRSDLFEGTRQCFGKYEECLNILEDSKLLGISPGGAREAFFANDSYSLLWDKRDGFAKLALQAKVPIIPVFTKNSREVYYRPQIFQKWLREFYEITRVPIPFIFGGFPVKLTTFIGEPIPYDPKITQEALKQKVSDVINALIKEHQPLPRSYIRAIWERLWHLYRRNSMKNKRNLL